MKVRIKRQDDRRSAPYWQVFHFRGEGRITVAAILEKLNERDDTEILRLEPLTKFPVVEDLMVDRSVIWERQKEALMYLGIRKHPDPKEHDHQYSAAKCLKCGLCLEVCPNYLGAKDDFYGAEFANNAYLLHSSSLNRKRALEKQYEEHFAKQCSKSLACRDICPAHLQTLSSISYMNRR